MASLRTGKYGGQYYGSYFYESEPLSQTQMQLNAIYLYQVLHYVHGWTANAVAALLGNMQAESTINPGRWQSDDVDNYNLGYGLVQWTPVTKYTDWCGSSGYSDPSDMDANIARILYEVENKIQWYATDSYNMSFSEFTTSEEDCSTLAKAFLLNYERPADQSESVQSYRAELANAWYTYITGNDPDTPQPETKKKKKKGYNFVVFRSRQKRRYF
jgi:hypothetical protein